MFHFSRNLSQITAVSYFCEACKYFGKRTVLFETGLLIKLPNEFNYYRSTPAFTLVVKCGRMECESS